MKFPSSKTVFSLLIGSAVLIAAVAGLVYWGFTQVGDLRPALFPTQENFADLIQQNTHQAPTVPEPSGTTTENLGASTITLPEGFTISVLTDDFTSPRDLLVTPEDILIVSDNESGEVLAITDLTADNTATTKPLLENQEVPHGLAFHNGFLYVAEETQLTRYTWNPEEVSLTSPQPLLELPVGGRHTSRTMVIKDEQLFISLGSRCDTCFEDHDWIAAVIVADLTGENARVYSSGLRNAVFLTLHPETQDIWATEMGRDFLGDNLPPDEINILQDSGNYGWPVCYGDKVYDESFGQRSPEYCENTIAPVFEIQAHSAPLGLTFIESDQFPDEWQNDLLVAYHGSWNRTVPVGYKIVRLEIGEDQRTVIQEHDFLTGFLQGREALGRPVDVVFNSTGHLYISDDKSGAIYRVEQINKEN